MKVAILAGGVGSRISEETHSKPKPMVEIGGMPLLWHIMMIYSRFGMSDFIIALGYKGEYVKKFFVDYCKLSGSLNVDLHSGKVTPLAAGDRPDWNIDLIDTGIKTATGGRIKRLAKHIPSETFMLTWGDGVADIDLAKLLAFHQSHGKIATVTAVRPIARFGHIQLEGDRVDSFSEKPQTAEGWINGAFFVLEPEIFDYIDGDSTKWEYGPMKQLAEDGQLMAYRHPSFWQCMDTLRDKKYLDDLWNRGAAPWKTWD